MSDPVQFAVEGTIDEAVVFKLFKVSGITPGTPYVCGGIADLRQSLDGFNAGARREPWFILCDLDREKCPATRRSDFFKKPQMKGLLFCVAVRSIEAWLMADRETFAEFLKVNERSIARYPEQLRDPKGSVLGLTRRSRDKHIKKNFAHKDKGGKLQASSIYNTKVVQYVRDQWSPQQGREIAPSLARALERCQVFAKKGSWV